jgi:hypothetical protein
MVGLEAKQFVMMRGKRNIEKSKHVKLSNKHDKIIMPK